MLRCVALGSTAPATATASASNGSSLAWRLRRLSTSSVTDRRKRNHFRSNKHDIRKNAATGATTTTNDNGESKQHKERSFAAASGGSTASNASGGPRQGKKQQHRVFNKKNNQAGNARGGPAEQAPVFTNKFQNLLSFAFEEDSSKSAVRSDGEEKKSLLVNRYGVATESSDNLLLSALGLDIDEDDDEDVEATLHKKHKKPQRTNPAVGAVSMFSASGSAAASVAAMDKRKQLNKSKKKKDGRSLLKNFQFENSLFDADNDLFGHIDWDEKENNSEGREKRRFQRQQRKQPAPKPVMPQGPQEVEIPTSISVKDLAERMSLRSKLLLRSLKDLGERGLTDESILMADIAELVVESLNMIPVLLPPDFIDLELTVPPEDCSMFPVRPPIISVMGHVDHGKTTLLDALRKSKIAASEAGGITQSIGAFTVNLGKKFGNQSTMTFIDTPGHAAFSSMRSRGSEVTDIIVLVVAADDGVRPQTVEVVQLALKSDVPMVVAVTKCDMHAHDRQEVVNRIGSELLQHGVVVESMGGETPLVCVSSKTGEGLDSLKETIALHAEVMDLRAEAKASGEAVVMEANVARGVGTQVDAIVKWGTLKMGSIVVCGLEYGKIRALVDQDGKRAKQITPGNPVRVIGLKGLPNAGDALFAVESEERAKEVIEQRKELVEWDLMATAEEEDDAANGNATPRRRRKYMGARRKWEAVELQRRHDADEAKRIASLQPGDAGYIANIVPIIVKTDSAGVIAAIDDLIASLPSDEAAIKCISSAVGPVSSSDIAMAEATGATVYSFNVKHPGTIDKEALDKNVSLRSHRVIYTMLDDIKELLSENVARVEQTEVIGAAEVIQAIPITTSGRRTTNIAGCKVTMGTMNMQARYRLIRDGETISEDVSMESMRHFQQKVAEVTKGQECGLQFDGLDEFLPGDLLQAYTVKMVKKAL